MGQRLKGVLSHIPRTPQKMGNDLPRPPVLGGRAYPLHQDYPPTARYFWTIFPPKSPQARPLETPLELGDPNCPSSRKLQTTFPSHNTDHAHLEKP